jgi:hypothetical protein
MSSKSDLEAAEKQLQGYENTLSKKPDVSDLGRWSEAARNKEKVKKKIASLKSSIAHEGKVEKYDKSRTSKIGAKEQKLAGDPAFAHLADVKGLQERQASLSRTATSGLSSQQRAVDKARVGATIRGQQRSVGRRMQSMLSGQGVRGAASSKLISKIQNKADKQAAGFDMSQMARSYAEKQKAGDKRAAMDMDIAQFDIGQDKSKLESVQSERIFRDRRRMSLTDSLKGIGENTRKIEESRMDAEL